MVATRVAFALCVLVSLPLGAAVEVGQNVTVSNVNSVEISAGWRRDAARDVLHVVSIVPRASGGGNEVVVHRAPEAGFDPSFGIQEVKITTQSSEIFSLTSVVSFLDSFGRTQSAFGLIDGGLPVAYCTVNGTNWTRVPMATQPVYAELQIGYTKSGLFATPYNALTHKLEFFSYNDRTGTFAGAGVFPAGSEMIDGAIFGAPRISIAADPKAEEELVYITFAIGLEWYLAQARRTLNSIQELDRTKLSVTPQTGAITESKVTHAGGDTYAAMTINSSGKYQIGFSSKLFNYPSIEVGEARPGVVGGLTIENYGENTLYFGMETPSGYFLRKALRNPFGVSVYDPSPITTTVPSRTASPVALTTKPFDFMSGRTMYTLYGRSLHVAKLTGCRNSRSRLCSANDRFEVSVSWRDSQGNTGNGRAIQLTGDTGYFWFFDEKNIELVVKVLDGCGVNQRYWVFAGGLTNVQADITVRDSLTGAVKTYRNPLNTPFQPVQDTGAFAGCSAGASAPVNVEFYPSTPRFEIAQQQGNCTPTATSICLNGRRFRVQATYRSNDGKSGSATAVSLTDDSGYFWFFNRENVELIAKVLNGCGVNGRQWVFAGGLTNVEVEMTVTDTLTGATKRYTNPQNRPFDPIQDTGAFVCQ